MMKKILFIFLCLSICGCAHTPIEYQTHMKLKYGMPKQEVLTVMGPPSEREMYEKHNKVIIEFLIYRNFVSHEDKTPIAFINNKLVGWGQSYYEDHVSLDDKRLK